MDMPHQYQPWIQKAEIPKRVILAVRPFYIDIGLEKSTCHTIPAEVFIVESLGDISIVSVDVLETRLQIVTQPDFRAKAKQQIWLAFDPSRSVLFDAETEKAVGVSVRD